MADVKKNTDPRWRYVYFFVAEKTEMVKIGVSDCVISRFRRVANLSPDVLTIAGAIASTRAKELEADLHEEFEELREHGEWFRLEGELAASIERLSEYDCDDLYHIPMWRDPLGDPFLLPGGPTRA